MSAQRLSALAVRLSAVTFILISAATSSVRAQTTLLNDSWTDGDRTNANLPTDSPTWLGLSSGNTSSVSPGALDFALSGNSIRAWEFFTSDHSAPDGNQPHNSVLHLNIGETLTTTLTFTLSGTTSALLLTGASHPLSALHHSGYLFR